MNIELLKELVLQIEVMNHIGASDRDQISKIVEFLYDVSGGDIWSYFEIVDKIRRAESEKEKEILRGGLEDAMHSMAHYSSGLSEKQPLRYIRNLDNLYFNGDNIAFVIRIAMAYFPNGTYDNCSNMGMFFFNRFRAMLRENKDKYLNGESTEWAKKYNNNTVGDDVK